MLLLTKSILTKVVMIITIIAGTVIVGAMALNLLIPIYVSYKLNLEGARAIGIIGGADGPTAIFLTGGLCSNFTIISLGVLTILGIIYLRIHKKKQDKFNY